MLYHTLAISKEARGVLTLTLNLAQKRNALSATMIEELTAFANSMASDDARLVILRGAGEIFCAGGDLAWMHAQIDADQATRRHEARKLATMLHALNTIPKPLLGLVQGGAFGGGVGMMAVCDYVIVDRQAKFGLTETRLGLIPATIAPYVMARLGEGMARRIFMSGQIFGAQEAMTMGLAAEVVDFSNEEQTVAVEKQIEAYLKTAPHAVAAAKRLTRYMGMAIDETMIEHSITALADIWQGEEAREGIAAFFAKQKPNWVKS